jgi:hypothetical protein
VLSEKVDKQIAARISRFIFLESLLLMLFRIVPAGANGWLRVARFFDLTKLVPECLNRDHGSPER